MAVFTDSSIAFRTVISPYRFPSKFDGVHGSFGPGTVTGSPETIVESVVFPFPRAARSIAASRTNGLKALPGCRFASVARLNWVSP